jgi:crotonobetainyl-CoA:carnitine CoA-transferase CaiB-like acyl-CoA transferase
MEGERADSELPPPALGEHTDEIVERLIDSAQLERLRSAGVIG